MKKISLTLLCSIGIIQLLAQQPPFLFVGTYTGGKSKGIYVYKFNSENGTATEVSMAEVSNPSYLCLSPDEKFLYSIQENGKDASGGEIAAFRFDANTSKLTLLNTQKTGGDHPCYVAIDQTGKTVVVGNYSGGNLTTFPVNSDGSLATAAVTIQHTGSSINKDRQEKPHVHCTVVSPDNKKILVPDLGIDKVMIYDLDHFASTLKPARQAFVASEPGAGPRHITFDPRKKFAYLVEELSGHVVAFRWKKGRLKKIQRISTLVQGETGFAGSADIHVSPDGKYLYASNRGDYNNLVIFKIDENKGTLRLVGHQSTLGKTPRHFNFDPSGKFLLAGNQNSDEIVVFRYDPATGGLTDTGNRIAVGKPVCFAWSSKY